MQPGQSHQGQDRTVSVWDLPVRLFHWILVGLIATSWITAEIGGNAMAIHQWSGFGILTLVLFRLLWGFFGGGYARFSSFVRSPAKALAYARALAGGRPPFFPGHNPLGGWMVLTLLASLLLQAGTGLFANDDIMTEGPLARHVSSAASDLLSKVHEINFKVLLTLAGLHIAAALFYLLAKRDNLILPMIHGRKRLPAGFDQEAPDGRPRLWLAALLLALCASAVWLTVR
jgi:cytochrome b